MAADASARIHPGKTTYREMVTRTEALATAIYDDLIRRPASSSAA